MVRILVQNADGTRLSYDVNLSDPIQTLKAEIEDTEGIPIDDQTFEFGPVPLDETFPLDETKTFESYNIEENSTILLNHHLFRVAVKTLEENMITFLVGPEYTCLRLKELILGETGMPLDHQRLLCQGRQLQDQSTLVSYGINKESTIFIVPSLRGGGGGPKARAIVLRNWNGNMRQQEIRGLPVERGNVVCIDQLVHPDWFRGYLDQDGDKEKGLFPRNFVTIYQIFDKTLRDELGKKNLPPLEESEDYPTPDEPSFFSALCCLSRPKKVVKPIVDPKDPNTATPIPTLPDEIPKLDLPDFPYPKTSPQFFTVKLGDKGLSFVEVAVTIKPLSTPAERPQVDVLLKCCPAHPRRISSVVLTLAFQGNEVDDIQPSKELGPETKTEIEKTDKKSKSISGGLDREGITLGAEWKHEKGETHSATRSTQMKISGLIKGADTALWSLTEDTGTGGQGGLPDRVPMSFSLSYKPAKVVYECRVTSVKDGSEKERYSDETRAFS